jgi:enamine deaminase RidA (YjgF/YER057c/UK114 family)
MNPDFTAYPLPGKMTFSAAVRAGPMLIVSGMTATDENRQIVGTDLETQTRYIFQKLGKVLEEAGASFADIIETVDYVTTFDGYNKTAVVRREFFGDGPYPAATGVQVAGLIRKGALIEIKAIAYIG